MTVLITGGLGFIGTNYIDHHLNTSNEDVINLDSVNYAGKHKLSIERSNNYKFIKGSINDEKLLEKIFLNNNLSAVINFAAETHVDKSIKCPDNFINTNILGTYTLIKTLNGIIEKNLGSLSKKLKFIHISTDEVYGTLDFSSKPFDENSPYKPNSPYAASKAASDHLVRAYNKTYNFPSIIINCSNNYGPFQYPEKLIPLTILNCLKGSPIPIYGNGKQIRDWLYVEDHCFAIKKILDEGKIGEVYNIGGNEEIENIKIVKKICSIMDKSKPRTKGVYSELITFVDDRPGHDIRYAISTKKIEKSLSWKINTSLDLGLQKTVRWYLNNLEWLEDTYDNSFQEWIKLNYK